MALAKVPIVPQWNLHDSCVCTPDGGFLYVGSRSINFIGRIKDEGTAPLIKVFHTRQTISSVDVDPAWPADNEEGKAEQTDKNTPLLMKYFAVLAQDNSVQIWDFNKGCAISGHKAHADMSRGMEGYGPPARQKDQVLLSYMRNRNVLSVDAQDLVVYCVASNSYCRRPTFVSSRNQQLTVLRCSPYNEHIFALGTSRGLVLVCDLQQMQIIYTLRGHDTCITSFSWTMVNKSDLIYQQQQPTTQNVPELKTKNAVSRTSNAVPTAAVAGGGDDIFDIYDYDYLENEFGAPSQAPTQKESEAVSDFVGIEKPKESETITKFDFAEACQSLKEEINALQIEPTVEAQSGEVTLADCQQAEHSGDLSSSCGGDDDEESTEGSLEVLKRSSSDDDIDVDGAEYKPKQQILHQAEVHATQTLEKKLKTIETGTEAVPIAVPKANNECNPIKTARETVSIDVQGNEDDDEEGDILLASASVDGCFWIWNTKTGASCDSMRVRSITGHQQGNQQGKNTQIEIVWLNATSFLTNNKHGDLSYYKLQPQPVSDKQILHRYKFKEEKRCYTPRGVVSFGICQKNESLWWISFYREVACENVLTGKIIAKYRCASTNISAMRECPDDMNKIALGFCDRRLGIIDISKMSPTCVYIENFSNRIESSVLSIVWSPDSKKLAYGTLEGRLGVINVENPKNQPITFNPICGKPIYSIAWQNTNIFVVCNEVVAVYEENAIKRDGQILAGIIGVSAISVRGQYIFTGTQRGHLKVYRRKPMQSLLEYELLQDFEMAPRYICDISWSPIETGRLAVVANANTINLLNFDDAQGLMTLVRKIEIKNTKAANACVKWSNRNANEFLTCGFDGAIRVWDVSSEANEEKFLKQYHCPMTCGLFLPTDEMIVVCAGKFTSIEFFDMRIEKSADYSAAQWKRSNAHALDNVQWAMKALTRPELKAPTANEKRRQKRAEAGSGVIVAEQNGNGVNADIANMISDLKIGDNIAEPLQSVTLVDTKTMHQCEKQYVSTYMKNPTTLLYLTTKELNKDALEKLFAIANDLCLKKQSENAGYCEKLFGTKFQAKELLAIELKNNQHSDKHGISSLLMPQMTVNLKEEILQCVQNKQLNEWHVSLAPTISYNFWQKCCQAFAEQLMEQGFILQAATYMIALHNQPETIRMLLEKNYFKEALLIARVYLQPDDPLPAKIVDKWITSLDATGNLPGAALLCTLSGQINRAYETLTKVRNSQPEIERVVKLLKSNDKFTN